MLLVALLACAPNAPTGTPRSAVSAADVEGRRLRGPFAYDGADAEAAVRALVTHEGLATGELALTHRRQGRSGEWLRFEQRHEGLPVFDGELVAGVSPAAIHTLTLALAPEPRGRGPGVLSDEAARAAAGAPGSAAVEPGWWGGQRVWRVRWAQPEAEPEVMVGGDGGVLRKRDRRWRATGTGLVFDPNPVASSGDTSLQDDQDRNSQALSDELVAVDLPRLDGSGMLRGDFVDARRANNNSRAVVTGLVYNYDREDNHFEEVMTYYHPDRAQDYIQSLGFTDVNNRVQVVTVDATRDDQSWYSPGDGTMSMGLGGVDDAEDAEILWHEYGHAIQDDQIPEFGVDGESSALGEGFGDYLAAALAATLSAQIADPYCVGDWDAISYDSGSPPCLRRVDSTKHYPEFMSSNGSIHSDGEMWSSALIAAREELSASVVDALVFEAQFSWARDQSFLEAAASLETADADLFGGAHIDDIRRIMIHQGLSRHLSDPADLPGVVEEIAVDVSPPTTNGQYDNHLDDTRTITQSGAEGLRLRFSWIDTELHNSCLDGACDNIYLTDGEGRLYQILSGSLGVTESVTIPGDTVNIRLVTDYSATQGGYRVEAVIVCGEEEVEDSPDPEDSPEDTTPPEDSPEDTEVDSVAPQDSSPLDDGGPGKTELTAAGCGGCSGAPWRGVGWELAVMLGALLGWRRRR